VAEPPALIRPSFSLLFFSPPASLSIAQCALMARENFFARVSSRGLFSFFVLFLVNLRLS